MGQESQKVMETKEKIKDAFFEIYKDKKIERISIKEITDRAKINRGTFYVYYKDIYDLLEQIEDDIIGELTDKILAALQLIIRDENMFQYLPPLEFFQKYSKYLKILLGSNGDPNFLHKIKSIAKGNLKKILHQEKIQINAKTEYILEYIASAQIGLMTYWMEKDMELPIEDIGDLIRQVSLHGPIGYIKSMNGPNPMS